MKAVAVAFAFATVVCGVLAFATWGDGSPSPFLELSIGSALVGIVWSGLALALHADRATRLALATNGTALGLWLAGLTWFAMTGTH